MMIDQLLRAAQDYYDGARKMANPDFKRALAKIGDTYLHEAEKLQRNKAEKLQRKHEMQ